MELRDIEIFLTLAEELHFRRTAERLHVSQARVSQVIKTQERRLGGALFERTSRTVRLTPLGDQLAKALRSGYDSIQHALSEATASTHRVSGTLTLGVMGALGHELRGMAAGFEAQHPGCGVRFREIHFSDPLAPLRSGAADVLLIWLPVAEPDLTVGPVLLTEGRVLAVAGWHELAGHADVSIEVLADHPVLRPRFGLPEPWGAAMLPVRTPGGRPVSTSGSPLETFHEALTEVAAGAGVAPLNAHVLRYYSHPGVTFVPIRDVPPTEWALVWRTTAESALIRAFADFARTLGPRAMH
ncbi:LysR family transcriptional regulator [Streptomyces sp. NPDC091272]|uniref:LysR family transcriptional regulator n=1 Tax=Streptomyces sp. NPDC091272 TaxID=3365981 RepID=UPI00381B75F6